MHFASDNISVRATARTFLKSGVCMLALGQGGAWATDAPHWRKPNFNRMPNFSSVMDNDKGQS
jgi:hypothetical protein